MWSDERDTFDFALARYNSNGTLDTSFGTSGEVMTDVAGASDQATSVALQADGDILVAGGADVGARYDFALARYVGGAGTGAATATTLASSINPSTIGASIGFTATISGTGPTATVNFRDGSSSIPGCSAVPLSGSGNARTASCATTSLGAGAHSITAAYSGDASNNGSTSAALSQVVNTTTGGGASSAWVDDALPAGATAGNDGDNGWIWVSSNPAPFAGTLAHQSALASGEHQHYFYNATATLPVAVGDTLFAYVYLDPANPPSEVMLQWNDGSWEHRAYWGANQIGFGTDGTASRRNMGPLPAPGQWVKLSVPAAQVGLEGHTLSGMAFTLYNGRATWDNAGK